MLMESITEETLIAKLKALGVCDAQALANQFVSDRKQMAPATTRVNSILYTLHAQGRVKMLTGVTTRPRWRYVPDSSSTTTRASYAKKKPRRGRRTQNTNNGTEPQATASRLPPPPTTTTTTGSQCAVVIDLDQCANRIMTVLQMPQTPVQVIACVSERYWTDANAPKPKGWMYMREPRYEGEDEPDSSSSKKKNKHGPVVRAIWYISQMVVGRQMDGPWSQVDEVHIYSNNDLFGPVVSLLRERGIRCTLHRVST